MQENSPVVVNLLQKVLPITRDRPGTTQNRNAIGSQTNSNQQLSSEGRRTVTVFKKTLKDQRFDSRESITKSGNLPSLFSGQGTKKTHSIKTNSNKRISKLEQIKQLVKQKHHPSSTANKTLPHELLSDDSLKRLLANDSLKYETGIKQIVEEYQAYSQLGFKIITNRRN